MQYHTKAFDGFDIMVEKATGRAFIVSETDPKTKPLIGPFNTPAEAIRFGVNRVENIK